MSELVRVSEKTYDMLERLKEREKLNSFDAVIRLALERSFSPRGKSVEELRALGDAVERFTKKNAGAFKEGRTMGAEKREVPRR